MPESRDPYGDPYSAHRFWVEIKGLNEAIFIECSGLAAEVEVEEWKEGGLNSRVHRLPGRVKSFPNLVLKRGVATAELWEWYYKVASGRRGAIERQNMTVTLKGGNDLPLVRWEIFDALPVKWSGPTFKSGSGEIAVEAIEFIHNGFERR
ncbi:MAG: phage tail protein [Chloroflexi bacterium OHK40]